MEKLPIEQSIEVVITHPQDTFTQADLARELPDFNKKRIYNQMGALKRRGYLEPIGEHGRGKTVTYRIKSREPYQASDKTPKSFPGKKKPEKVQIETKSELSMEQMGLAIYGYIGKLKDKISQLSEGYSNIQSELQREIAASKIRFKTMANEIAELRAENNNLRGRLKKQSGKTFSLGELANFK